MSKASGGELMLDINRVSDDEWDAFVASHPEGHHEQCSGFACQRADYGFQANRVVIRDGGVIVAGAQILLRKTRIGRFGLLLRAPLVSASHAAAVHDLGEAILVHARRRACAGLRAELFPTQMQAFDELTRLGWAPLPVAGSERESCIVALAGSREERLEAMHYNVRRYSGSHDSQASLSIENAGREGLVEFYRLYSETADFHGFLRFPPAYFDYLWEVFGTAGRLHCILALLDGEPVAGVVNTVVGSRMYYGWGGMARHVHARRAKPNYPLHLAAMEVAGSRGLTHYDLTGTSPFKRQFVPRAEAWPAPMQQFFGNLAVIRRLIARQYQQGGLVYRSLARLSRGMDLHPRMPY